MPPTTSDFTTRSALLEGHGVGGGDLQRQRAPALDVLDDRRPQLLLDVGELAQRDEAAARQRDRRGGEGLRRVRADACRAHDHVALGFALAAELTHDGPVDVGVDDQPEVGGAHALRLELGAVGLDAQLGGAGVQARDGTNLGTRQRLGERAIEAAAQRQELAQVRTRQVQLHGPGAAQAPPEEAGLAREGEHARDGLLGLSHQGGDLAHAGGVGGDGAHEGAVRAADEERAVQRGEAVLLDAGVRDHLVLEPLGDDLHLADGVARRRVDDAEDDVAVSGGQVLDGRHHRDAGDGGQAEAEDRDEQRQGLGPGDAMHGTGDAAAGSAPGVGGGLGGGLAGDADAGLEQARGEARDDEDRDHQRREDREGHGHGDVTQQLADLVFPGDDRQEHGPPSSGSRPGWPPRPRWRP
jgi:hypothetical protein